ncbi:hypothetical protein BCBD1442_27560 [Brucella ceti]|nr:hypothetical protein BCBD1442_27560 [Brucella ceti]
MVGRMPILRDHDIFAFPDQAVDDRDDFIATFDGQGAAGAKIILDVDNHKCMADHGMLRFVVAEQLISIQFLGNQQICTFWYNKGIGDRDGFPMLKQQEPI